MHFVAQVQLHALLPTSSNATRYLSYDLPPATMTDQATLIVVCFCDLPIKFLDTFFAGFGVISMKKMREDLALDGVTSREFPLTESGYYRGIRVQFKSKEFGM